MPVREIDRIDDLDALRGEWRELLSQTPRAGFFQSLEWLEAYWRHFGAGQRLRVLVVEAAGEITGIVPLVVRRERTAIGSLRFLTYPLDYWGSFYGPIGPDPAATLRAAVQELKETGFDADIFEPRWVHEDDREETALLLDNEGLGPQASPLDASAVIDLSGTWSDYLASRNSKWRNNYRRARRQLEELGTAEYVRYRPQSGADPRWDLFDECLHLALISWQGASTTGTTLTHADVAPFLRDAHDAATRCGNVDINLLRVNGRAVSYAYNYVQHGRVFGLRSGYDPTLRGIGVGKLLYTMAVEDSFRRGDTLYDLGPGYLDCKRSMLTNVVPIHRITCGTSWSLRQRLLRLKRQWDGRRKAAEEAGSRT
ncbi:MAG: GNAT family N-acetyltransferase [Planctomycetota bacterium]